MTVIASRSNVSPNVIQYDRISVCIFENQRLRISLRFVSSRYTQRLSSFRLVLSLFYVSPRLEFRHLPGAFIVFGACLVHQSASIVPIPSINMCWHILSPAFLCSRCLQYILTARLDLSFDWSSNYLDMSSLARISMRVFKDKPSKMSWKDRTWRKRIRMAGA